MTGFEIPKDIRKALPEEMAIAGTVDDITEAWGGMLRSMRDSILAVRGGDLALYEEVRRDDRVMTALQQRRLALISKPWTVTPGGDDPQSEKAAQALELDLQKLGWDRVCDMMWWGHFWGHAVAELIWTPRTDSFGTRWTWEAIKVRKARRFRYDTDGNLRLITTRNGIAGEVMPKEKFWTFSAGEDADDYPYGLGLAHWLYWPVYFKRVTLKAWVQAVDRYGTPVPKGTFPSGQDGVKRALMEAMRALRAGAAVAVPEGAEIELMETARQSGADQAILYAAMDRAIAAIITGQTTSIEAASNRSQTETHKDIRDELVQADSDLISASFQAGPLTQWTAWNFPGAQVPWVGRQIEDGADQVEQVSVDEGLNRLGWELEDAAFEERYGAGYRRKGSVIGVNRAGTETPPAFAAMSAEAADFDFDAPSFDKPGADEPDAISEAARRMAASTWQTVVMPVKSRVDQAMDQVTDLAGLEQRLTVMMAEDREPPVATVAQIAGATLQAKVAGMVAAPLTKAEARQNTRLKALPRDKG